MDNVRHMPRDQADTHGPEQYDAERYVIGGCMHNPRDIPTVRGILTRADFALPAHELLWDVLGYLHDEGKPISPLTIRLELEKRKELRRAGGIPYINQIGDYALDPEFHALEVRRQADLRAEADLGRRIVQRATEPDAVPGSAVTFIDDYLQRQKERAAGRSGDPADALLAELLDASSLDNMPTLEPLVGDLLHLDSLARIVGPSGHMKSFVTIDLAGHVGTGMNWHGHYVRQGTVVYLVAEGARGIRKRVRAWEKHYGLKMDNVLFLPRPVQAMGPEWDTLIEAMRRLQPQLIVIDTQARISVGVEENSAKELGVVVERIEELRRATQACVLVIHHTGHVGEHGRGSSSAKGALQSELHVSKKGDTAKNIVVTVKVGKQKDDEESDDLQFGLKVITLDGEAKPDGRPVTSVVLESLDHRPAELVPGTPEWLVSVLDKAQVPLKWGSPRVIKWCAEYGISMRKEKVEEAVRIRKRRDSFDEAQDARNDLPPNLPRDLESELPHDQGGSSGENQQTRRSNLPPNPGGGPGDVPPQPPSPRPVSRTGGGTEGDPGTTDPQRPICRICDLPMNPDWANRGYDTHLGCDPATGSHPDRPQHPTTNPERHTA
ncbi:AAA family ATPase [Streptomyces longwoodensis]|uniref:AAA family ATPase n=1 Tax=Streptomyces longwoodensis TaxID=68231 RepID=UPI002DD90479|nr:AAA family ATPase [Streptomyces longwoodensis]WRY87358.1 AAA family ATPase [Streptomyces longwoodensis]